MKNKPNNLVADVKRKNLQASVWSNKTNYGTRLSLRVGRGWNTGKKDKNGKAIWKNTRMYFDIRELPHLIEMLKELTKQLNEVN